MVDFEYTDSPVTRSPAVSAKGSRQKGGAEVQQQKINSDECVSTTADRKSHNAGHPGDPDAERPAV